MKEGDNAYSNNREVSNSGLGDFTKELFRAIENSEVHTVELLLNHHFEDDAFMNLCQTDANGNTCLHLAAGQHDPSKSKKAEEIIKLLLHKMHPLLLGKNNLGDIIGKNLPNDSKVLSLSLSYDMTKSDFFEQSPFWKIEYKDWNKCPRTAMKNRLDRIQEQRYRYSCNTDSMLLCKNANGETPLWIAMKIGSPGLLKYLLDYTHRFVGLDLTSHISKSKKDLIMVLQRDNNAKILINEYQKCDTSLGRYGHIIERSSCKAYQVANALQRLSEGNSLESIDTLTLIHAIGISFKDELTSGSTLSRIPAYAASTSSSSSRGHLLYQLSKRQRLG
ncbi:hypothetical protein ACRRVD_02000 [Candidatus Cardinium hertigii]|uniref:hypothetical protein n=1 Tax=Candidatus Cardinium hertigii TaxID=247481 RepID=UPI003D7CC7F1